MKYIITPLFKILVIIVLLMIKVINFVLAVFITFIWHFSITKVRRNIKKFMALPFFINDLDQTFDGNRIKSKTYQTLKDYWTNNYVYEE